MGLSLSGVGLYGQDSGFKPTAGSESSACSWFSDINRLLNGRHSGDHSRPRDFLNKRDVAIEWASTMSRLVTSALSPDGLRMQTKCCFA
jgi:hypothetical protein